MRIKKALSTGLRVIVMAGELALAGYGGHRIGSGIEGLMSYPEKERPRVVVTYLKDENTGLYSRMRTEFYSGNKKTKKTETELGIPDRTKDDIQNRALYGTGCSEVKFE